MAWFIACPIGIDAAKVGPILAHTQCRFKAPLTYPDTITTALKVENIEADDDAPAFEPTRTA